MRALHLCACVGFVLQNEDQIERNVSPNRSRSPSVLSGRHPSDRSLSDSTVDGSTAFSTLLSQQDDYIVNQIQLQLGLSDANIEVMLVHLFVALLWTGKFKGLEY